METTIPARSLSVVMPAYNEEKTLREVVEIVLGIEMVGEVLIVDDGSADETVTIAQGLEKTDERVRLIEHAYNQGKGAALKTGFKAATLPYVIVQDADMEYDPQEFERVILPIHQNKADVVYGSRYLKRETRRVLRFWHTLGNRFLTTCSNMFSDLHVTDMETCYKGFRREVIQAIPLQENRFGFEPEVTAWLSRMRVRVMETSVSYFPRSYDEGKKIGWKDGVRALWCIFKYNVLVREVIDWTEKAS